MDNTNKLVYCIVGSTADIAVQALKMLDQSSATTVVTAGGAAVRHGRRRKSPAKKLQNQVDNEASLVFADPKNFSVIRVWASRILARSLPAAMNLNNEQCACISKFAQDIAKLVDADEDSSANMLLRAGEYVVRNNKQKMHKLRDELHMRLVKQHLTVPSPSNGFNSGAPTPGADDDEIESPISRTSVRGF